jgi:membrane-associated protein
MFGELLAWLQGLSHPMVLAVTGLLVLSETVVGPGVLVPGESGLLAASTTATTPARFLTLWGVVFSCAVIGDSAGYLLGRRYGDRLSALAPARWLGGRSAWERAAASLRRRGAWAVVLGRLVPVARTFTPAAAGCAQLQAHRFFPAAIGGALLWSLIHVLVGASLGRAAHRIEPLMNAGIWVLLVVLGIGGIAKLVRHRSKMTKTPERRPSLTTTEFPLANQCAAGQLHIGPPTAGYAIGSRYKSPSSTPAGVDVGRAVARFPAEPDLELGETSPSAVGSTLCVAGTGGAPDS